MESNTQHPGDDMVEETLPVAEHTSADESLTPEASADASIPQAELTETDEMLPGDEVLAAVEASSENGTGEAGDESSTEAAPEAVEQPPARFKARDIVEGIVVDTSPTEVLIDLGEGVIGVVDSRELERMDHSALEALEVGKTVTAYVLKVRGSDQRPVLSLARAEEESNWRLAEQHYASQEVYFSKVAGYNKGGLIVRFGKVRGFVPASQVSRERQRQMSGSSPEERWGAMVGDDIAVKVVEIDRARNRLILSERAAAREWREQQKARLLSELRVGEVRKGRVISLADFGAFIDIGGADGLVHLTEMSWQHVTHPREVLEVGQEVEVTIINIDPERKRIGLSLKQQADDPWQQVVAGYAVGQRVQATVTKLTKFGAFARLVDAPEVEGLIHISELADYRVSHPREVVLVGDVLTLRIVKINAEQRRLGLSLRQVDSARFMDQDWGALIDEYEAAEAARAEEESEESEDAAGDAGSTDENA